jgi:hypothetical protein
MLGKILNFLGLQFPYPFNGNNRDMHLLRLFDEFKKIN